MPNNKINEDNLKSSQKRSNKKTNENNNKKESSNKTGNIFEDFAKTTSHVVQQAASILEEEIAAGIIAAKQAEKRFIKVNESKKEKSDEVIQRFRKDTHEVIDILLDLVGTASKYFDNIIKPAIVLSGTTPQDMSDNIAGGQTQILTVPKQVKPGTSAKISMSLENKSNQKIKNIKFFSTDLINSSGDKITAENIIFLPGSLSIEPNKTGVVIITINTSKKIQPGIYAGLVQISNFEQNRAVLLLSVE